MAICTSPDAIALMTLPPEIKFLPVDCVAGLLLEDAFVNRPFPRIADALIADGHLAGRESNRAEKSQHGRQKKVEDEFIVSSVLESRRIIPIFFAVSRKKATFFAFSHSDISPKFRMTATIRR